MRYAQQQALEGLYAPIGVLHFRLPLVPSKPQVALLVHFEIQPGARGLAKR